MMTGVGVQICRSSFVFGRLVCHTFVIINNLLWCRLIFLVEIFPTVSLVLSSEFRCASKNFLFYFLLSPLCSQITRRREKEKKKKIPETYQSFSHNNNSTVRKISKRWIQRHKKKSLMVTKVCHTYLNIFRWLVWPTSIVVGDLPYNF
jgi:hypothetical protein